LEAAYADANGDGIVDIDDVLVLMVNWTSTEATASSVSLINKELYRDNFKHLYQSINGDNEPEKKMRGLLNSLYNFEVPPITFELSQNFPNPFNPVTTITYGIPAAGNYSITIYDVNGRVIQNVKLNHPTEGYYNFEFDGSGFSSGIYFYKLQSQTGLEQFRKMVFLK